MKIKSLQDLFETGLKYAYDYEQKLVKKGIPSLIEASSSSELRNALEQHLDETRGQISRLEQVFSSAPAPSSRRFSSRLIPSDHEQNETGSMSLARCCVGSLHQRRETD